MDPDQTPILIIRPKTRGELASLLKEGKTCEVVEYVSEMTTVMLKGWLNVSNFTVQPSTNPGWVLYVPNTQSGNSNRRLLV